MRLTRLFKRRVCAVAVAAAMFLCLAVANAGAQDILWDIQNAIWRDEGDKVVRLIRQNGIDINGNYYIHLAGYPGKDMDFATALSSATYAGSPNVVKALLDAGADVNAMDRGGGTALFAPRVQSGGKDGVKASIRILINYGADINARYGDRTALMEYARWGAADFVKILLDADADVNIRNNEGETALMIAERVGNAEKAKLLRGARGYR